MQANKVVVIDGATLDIESLVAVARHDARVEISKEAIEKIGLARVVVDSYVKGPVEAMAQAASYGITDAAKLAEVEAHVSKLAATGTTAYGVTTGFGELARVRIPVKDAEQLQYNLIRSHASGTGRPLARDAARASVLIRANTLCTGACGVRPSTVQAVVDMLNAGITPIIPCQGSVGASGDLAPSAHMALALIGEGSVEDKDGKQMPAKEALARAGLQPLKLASKEGLSLINGTQVMTGVGALCIFDGEMLWKAACIAAGMSQEALWGTAATLDPRIHQLRPHPGQIRAADAMRKCVAESAIMASHASCSRVQDAYSMRCAPQVIGPVADALAYARRTVEIEMNSATDNPLVFSSTGEIKSNGNFHGEPVAMVMDFLGIALAELASVAERRVARLVDPNVSGLPAFLTKRSGLHSGFMMAQYTCAALVSENKIIAHPACVDSIPTSANQEDHVSMGTIAARKCADICRHSTVVIAVELLTASQGLDLHEGVQPGRGSAAARAVIRNVVPPLDEDRVLATDMACVVSLIENGSIVNAVEAVVGSL